MLQHTTSSDGSFESQCTVHVETRDADQRLTSSPTPVRAWPAAIAAMAGDDVGIAAGWDTLDAQSLRALAPHLSIADATRWAMLLSAAMDQARINTPARRAAFLAQVLIETEYFKWLSESGWITDEACRLRALRVFYGPHAVSPRNDVITAAGTAGPHYYGRGLLMLTGRDDYAALSHELFNQGVLPDRITSPTTLLDQPQLVA